jgi:hypothetical protein
VNKERRKKITKIRTKKEFKKKYTNNGDTINVSPLHRSAPQGSKQVAFGFQ